MAHTARTSGKKTNKKMGELKTISQECRRIFPIRLSTVKRPLERFRVVPAANAYSAHLSVRKPFANGLLHPRFFLRAEAAAIRVGEESCGFKSALSLVCCFRFESSFTPIKSCFYDAGETTRPRNALVPTPTISTCVSAPISDSGPSANTACI